MLYYSKIMWTSLYFVAWCRFNRYLFIFYYYLACENVLSSGSCKETTLQLRLASCLSFRASSKSFYALLLNLGLYLFVSLLHISHISISSHIFCSLALGGPCGSDNLTHCIPSLCNHLPLLFYSPTPQKKRKKKKPWASQRQ